MIVVVHRMVPAVVMKTAVMVEPMMTGEGHASPCTQDNGNCRNDLTFDVHVRVPFCQTGVYILVGMYADKI